LLNGVAFVVDCVQNLDGPSGLEQQIMNILRKECQRPNCKY
jgi:hypothetical protein